MSGSGKAVPAKPSQVEKIVVAMSHPIALPAFLAKIRGTRLEVYSRLLRARHGREKRREAEWHAAIKALAVEPVPVKTHSRVQRPAFPMPARGVSVGRLFSARHR